MRNIFNFSLFLAIAILTSVDCQNNELRGLKWWKRVSDALTIFSPDSVLEQVKGLEFELIKLDNGTKCNEQMAIFRTEIRKGAMWALKMMDSSSKIPTGIIMGHPMDLGMYDECLEVYANESGHEIRGRHCTYSVLPAVKDVPLYETLSICVPSWCGPADVRRIVTEQFQMIRKTIGTEIPLNISSASCSPLDPREWTTGGILTLTGFILLTVFLVVCTMCEFMVKYSNEKPTPDGIVDTLREFSLYSNSVSVLKVTKSAETLSSINGLRFFSMCWVIMGHTHMMFFPHTVNIVAITQWITRWESLYMLVATFAVDSFFTISGFLMSYIFLRDMANGRSFNLFSYYRHRYVRLTPSLAALLLLAIYIFPRIGSGPVWDNNSNHEIEACKKGWWPMILYIHNYMQGTTNICLGHTWYLADEMHYFWLSPLILYPLAKNRKLGLGILAAFFVASIIVPVKIGWDGKYSSALIANRRPDKNNSFITKFYLVSHVRIAPWLVGVYFGYLYFTGKGTTTSKLNKWIGWLSTTAAFAFCVFTMTTFQGDDYEYNDVWEAIYTALARPLWGFAVSWIIYASARDFGGPVSKILSFAIYTPLSRISYGMYLLHFEIQYIKLRTTRTSAYFSPFNAMNNFLSDFMLSIIFGFIFTIAIETPFTVLEKILKKRWRRYKKSKLIGKNEVENGIDNPQRYTITNTKL